MLRAVSNIPLYLGADTYANIVANWPAASYSGRTARATNIGVGPGMMLVSDGTRWIPDGMQVLGRAGAAASITGTLTETALATITVPAGLMGVSGSVLIQPSWTVTNSANNKTVRIRFGGLSGTAFGSSVLTTVVTYMDLRTIRNRNATNSQVGSAPTGVQFNSSSGSLVTAAVDTTAAVDIVLSAQLANTGETITLETYEVCILP